MKIVVCIKIVQSKLVFGENGCEDSLFFNPYDLKALEEAIKVKNQFGAKIICLSMGTKATEEILHKCYALGCDEVILLNDECFAGSDTIATSYILAKALEKIGDVDIVVCGEKSIDGETGQVVYGLGERLQLPVISRIIKLEELRDTLAILKVNEQGGTCRIATSIPTILSISEFSTAYPKINLLKLKQAKREKIKYWSKDDINIETIKCGVKGSRTKVKCLRNVVLKRNHEKVEGDVQEKAVFLMNLLRTERNE